MFGADMRVAPFVWFFGYSLRPLSTGSPYPHLGRPYAHFVGPRSDVVTYAILPTLLFDFSILWSLTPYYFAFDHSYSASLRGARPHTEHTQLGNKEMCVF
jgi:hypothetical protein